MTFLRPSTLALRRWAMKSRPSMRRLYTQLSSPALKAEQTISTPGKKFGEGLALPIAFVILGLSFSTFSTHQIMTCHNSSPIQATAAAHSAK